MFEAFGAWISISTVISGIKQIIGFKTTKLSSL